jgi:hypothetical protein
MGDWRGHTEVWWGDLRESYHLEDIGIDDSIKLKLIFKKWNWEGMDGIDLVQDRDRFRVLVNAMINHQLP